MKYIDWDSVKNERLKIERNISFEEVLIAIHEGRLMLVEKHPNLKKYRHQQIMLVEIEGYAYVVPFVEDEKKYFLKTIIPSRKLTKKYIIRSK